MRSSMSNYLVRSKSLKDARTFFNKVGDNVWQVKSRSNKISPHITITFSSDLNLSDLRNVISENCNDHMMINTLRPDSREIHLV